MLYNQAGSLNGMGGNCTFWYVTALRGRTLSVAEILRIEVAKKTTITTVHNMQEVNINFNEVCSIQVVHIVYLKLATEITYCFKWVYSL